MMKRGGKSKGYEMDSGLAGDTRGTRLTGKGEAGVKAEA